MKSLNKAFGSISKQLKEENKVSSQNCERRKKDSLLKSISKVKYCSEGKNNINSKDPSNEKEANLNKNNTLASINFSEIEGTYLSYFN